MLYDVIIIGAGCTGSMTAYRLAKYDLRVLVLEAGNDIASGATKANSAISHAGFDAEVGTLKAKLNVAATREMPSLAKKLDIDYDMNGTLVMGFGEEELPHLKELYERGVKNGVPNMEIVGGERLYDMEPNLSREATHALYAPTGGIVSAWGLPIAAAECAAVNGTEFVFHYRVNSIKKDDDGNFTVSNGSTEYRAKFLVNAAGVWGDHIAELAGERDFPARIIPRRGEYMLLDKTEGKTAKHVLFSVPRGNGKGILVSPTVHGNLIVGPNAYKIDDRDDKQTTEAGLSEILAGAKRLVPTLNDRAVITSFSGVRPTPSTGDYYIQPSEQVGGLLHLAGIESPGLASSPAVGAYAVELLEKMGLELRERKDFRDERPEQIRFESLDDISRAELIRKNPAYGRIICRCETVTEGEIIDAIHRPVGARDIDMVKRRTRAGMGRCQGGFCMPRVAEILARELDIPLEQVTKFGGSSWIVKKK